jgi:hypothetical protein
MLSLQRFYYRLSAFAISAREHSTSLINWMSTALQSPIVKRSLIIYGIVPFHLIIALAPAITANCSDQFVVTLIKGLGMVINVLMGLGVAIAVIGIVVGGLMRATAWGNPQKIATSNKAIICAVIGLVIVLLGVTLGSQVPSWFGNAAGSCSNFGS